MKKPKPSKKRPHVMLWVVQFLLLALGIGALCMPIWSDLNCQDGLCRYTSGSVVYFRHTDHFRLQDAERISLQESSGRYGTNYSVAINIPGKTIQLETFQTKAEAEALLRELKLIQTQPQQHSYIDRNRDASAYCIFCAIVFLFALVDINKKAKPKTKPKKKTRNRTLALVPSPAQPNEEDSE